MHLKPAHETYTLNILHIDAHDSTGKMIGTRMS